MKTLLRVMVVLSLSLVGIVGVANTALAQNNPEGSAYANVVVCNDPDCADLTNTVGMEGAIVTSLDAAGTEIDSCAIETFPSGMDGCVVTQHDGDGWYEVSNMYAGYILLSEEPEVLESESHGTQLVWYAAPVADDAPPPADGTDPVMDLPETGAGIGENSGFLAAAAMGIALMAVGATGARRLTRC